MIKTKKMQQAIPQEQLHAMELFVHDNRSDIGNIIANKL